MHCLPSPTETLKQMLQEAEPNLLRLYLNPHVAQTCFCLDRYVRGTWTSPKAADADRTGEDEDCQSFLANSLEEALGGAIKLLRYHRGEVEVGRIGLILDLTDRLTGFVHAELADGGRVEFLPGFRVIGGKEMGGGLDWLGQLSQSVDQLVLVSVGDVRWDEHADAIRQIMDRYKPDVITCVDRASLALLRGESKGILGEVVPDVVVFDESFVGHGVPFAAFTARTSLFAAWNRPGKSTFHSTTFQPNTISTRHFMNVLAVADPEFFQANAEELRAMTDDLTRRGDAFRRYYQPSLYRLIRAAGFETSDIRASGSYVHVNGRPILDFVGGVACSVQGHNPTGYVDEMNSLPASVEAELGDRLRELTGLGFVLPAVSGANAVENALRLALIARFPRRHVLALKAGFGGKTLLSLTSTANPSYKDKVGPLYADVHYVDPFAPDALEQIDSLLREHVFAVVQVELIQSVGGVRRIPETVARHLDEGRARWGYLLIVDEIQTGLYRTGPFLQSQTFGLTPDFLLLGKGTSDMMFPFSLTLYSDAVAEQLASRGSTLAEAIRSHYGYELGYKTVLNVLRLAASLNLSHHVTEAGEQFERRLRDGLAPLKIVREVRVFGLLIAIELDASTWPRRWLRKRLAAPYLLAMLHHKRFALMAGFCQYEPNTLKITPSLNVRPEEIVQACETIVDVLSRPLHRVLPVALGRLLKPSPIRKGKTMSAGMTQRLSLLHLDFDGLYNRHLGRHSQLGINIAHLIALYGIWFGIYATISQGALLLGMPASWPILVAMAVCYVATISINSPIAVTVATAVFVALLVANVLALPALPAWAILGFLALIPLFYKVQAYSHKVWTVAADMSEHNKRIPPGRDLNLILLFYEIPICLKYLLFSPKDWKR